MLAQGENGGDAPLMLAARGAAGAAASWIGGGGTAARHKAVHEYFPKLAYTTSDVVIVVCREPFYNRCVRGGGRRRPVCVCVHVNVRPLWRAGGTWSARWILPRARTQAWTMWTSLR